MIVQIFIPTAELVIPTRTKLNEATAECETQPVSVKTKSVPHKQMFSII